MNKQYASATAIEADADASGSLATWLRDAQPFLTQLARRLCRNQAEVADLVQDTCEHALRAGTTLPNNPCGWMTTVMRNLFIDRSRASARRPQLRSLDDVPQMSAPEAVAEPIWMAITVDQIRAALDELEPRFSDVYRLHSFEHRTYAEIAVLLAVPPVTIGTRLTRARQKLRAILVCRHGGRPA